jgi:MYXO-CTERM domain-containing protein
MRLFSSALAGLVCSALASVAPATVLTFDTGSDNLSLIPTSYGNRVGDPATYQPPQFHYGPDGGVTPNVNIVYSPVLRLGGGSNPFDASRVFGDLANVIYRDRDGGLEPGILQVSFFADDGYQVCLHSFDLAATYNMITGQGEDLSAKSIKIIGDAGVVLFDREFNPLDTDPASPTSTVIPGTMPLAHKHFDFESGPICGQTVTIRIDLNNYITIGGTKIDRFGLDNIKISQSPTPGAGALLALAACFAGFGRRRRTIRPA